MNDFAVWLLIYSVKASFFAGAVLLVLAACRRASAALRSGVAVAGAMGAGAIQEIMKGDLRVMAQRAPIRAK